MEEGVNEWRRRGAGKDAYLGGAVDDAARGVCVEETV